MKKTVFVAAIICISLFAVSCSTTKTSIPPSSLNGEWSIVEVEGTKITESTQQHTPYIGFDFAEKRIYGNSGCNHMMGTFNVDSLKSGMISFGPIAGTRMACPDMTVEQNILNALEKVHSYEGINCDNASNEVCKIALRDAAGKHVVVIERREGVGEEGGLTALKGEWNIKTINGETVVVDDQNPQEPFIGFNFDDNRVYGNAGCNTFNGGFSQQDNNDTSLEFKQVVTTMMMCINMDTERKVLDALDHVKAYRVMDDGKVALYDEHANEVMVLQKK